MAQSKALQAIVEIAGSISPTLGKSIEEATGKLGGLNVKALAVGAAIGGAALAATKAMADFAKESVEAAASYETAFAAASTLMQGTEEELQGISDEIIKTSNKTGIAAEDLADSVYSAISAGIAQEDAVEFAGKAARLAAAGFTDVDTALSATAKTLNAYGMSAEQADDIQKVLIQTQNLGITTVDELGASLAQVTPTAAAFGVSFDQVGASLAVMTAQGTPTAQATTQLNSLIAELAKNGTVAAKNLTEAAKGTKYAGMSFSEMMDSGANLADVLDMVQNYADKSGVSMVDMFSSIEAGKGALAIFSGEGKKFRDDLVAMGTDADVVGEAYGKVTNTFEHQMEVLQNLGKNAKISFGERLLPMVTQVAQSAIPLLESAIDQLLPVFDSLSDSVMPTIEDLLPKVLPMIAELIPPIVEMASALATELIPPIIDIIASIIPVLIQLLQMVMPVLKTLIASVLPIIVKLVQKLLPPILQIIQAVLPVLVQLLDAVLPLLDELLSAVLPIIIGLIDALLPLVMTIIEAVLPVAIQLLETVIPILTEILSAILPVIIELINMLVPILSQIIEAVLPILIEVLNLLTPILDLVIALLQPILDLFIMLLEPILNLIMAAIQPLIDMFTMLITSILEPIQPILTFLASLFSDVLGGAIAGIQPIIDALMQVFGGLIDFISGVFSGNWEQAWNGIVGVFKGIFNLIPSVVEFVINGAIDIINGIIKGINSVSQYVGLEIGLIPHVSLPRFAAGGFTEGISIAGEAGTEAIISFDPAYREENIGYWLQAGEMLGLGTSEDTTTSAAGKLLTLDDFSLSEMAGGQTIIYYDFSGFTWSPTFGGTGEEDEDLMAELRDHEAEFFDWLEEWLRIREEGRYCRA